MLTQVNIEQLPSYELGMEKGVERGVEQGVEKGMTTGFHKAQLRLARNLLDLLSDGLDHYSGHRIAKDA